MARTGKTTRAASVQQLDRVVDALVGEVSAVRARQLRMVVGMWALALEPGTWPEGRRRPVGSVAAMFTGPAVRAFWELAAAGRLRTRGVGERERPMSLASLRVVRDCLGILAEEALPGRAVWLPSVAEQAPKPVVARGQLAVLYRRLVDMASDAPVERAGLALSLEDRVRLLALVAIVLDTGARSGELEGMRLDDLGEGEARLVVRRRPQNGADLPYRAIAAESGVEESVVARVMAGSGRPSRESVARVAAALERLGEGGPVVEECRLREGTQVALRRWLRVRGRLVAGLEGGEPAALWVGLQANQWQPHAGLPLRAQGIQRAYARGAVALNGLMAGRLGWEPLPTTLEQVRRAVSQGDVLGVV